ncbi:MAG: hypothetical protein ABI606_05345 [Rhodoferax sp.]
MSTIENATNIPSAIHRMSPISQAILVHVSEHPNCTFEALQTLFCFDDATGAAAFKGSAIGRFRARLVYLAGAGHLQRSGIEGAYCYQLGDGARPPKPARVYAATESDNPALWRTPAPQYDLKNAPQYVPDAGPVIRAGAMDFQRCASVGHSC